MQVSQPGLVESAFAMHHRELVGRVTRMTRDPDVAEDVVQEAFVRLAREVDNDRAPLHPRAWLHHVAGNLVRSWARHRSVVDRHDADLFRPRAIGCPEAAVLGTELGASIEVIVGELLPAARTALLLSAEGYAPAEIAVRLGRSPGATRTLLCRTRQKVRDRLEVAGSVP
ncbi:MAG TPA: RNA polymerase sigma factor [Candidatus Eisenbacteria bacterium]|nr:RNA polymerase sigma factor [Candidatus Eisenbacteria bacterium]